MAEHARKKNCALCIPHGRHQLARRQGCMPAARWANAQGSLQALHAASLAQEAVMIRNTCPNCKEFHESTGCRTPAAIIPDINSAMLEIKRLETENKILYDKGYHNGYSTAKARHANKLHPYHEKVRKKLEAQIKALVSANKDPIEIIQTVKCNEWYLVNEDMSPDGKLGVLVQEDGDIVLQIFPSAERHTDCVEFCTPFGGGGRHPKVRDALLLLLDAIRSEQGDQS